MRPLYLLLTLLIGLLPAYVVDAQACDCNKAFTFITNYVEKNQASFFNNITPEKRPQYERFKAGIRQQVASDGKRRCALLLMRYMRYFRDHHSQIAVNTDVNIDDPVQLKTFITSSSFLNTETVPIDSVSAYWYASRSKDPIEGIYDLNGTYRVLIRRDTNAYRDYYGLIISTTSPVWKPGQVKLELKKQPGDTYEYLQYLRDHSLTVETLSGTDGGLVIGDWRKVLPAEKPTKKMIIDPVPTELTTFRLLDDSTAYLSIRSFARDYITQLDSTFRQIMPVLKSKPYLIVDVRDNSGGSTLSYQRLAPLLYTQSSTDSSRTEYLATTAIIAQYEELLRAKPNPVLKAYRERLIQRMKQVPMGTFIRLNDVVNDTTPDTGSVLKYPQRIAILYNSGCGSSCENFVLAGRRSQKVVTIGENSGGYVGYGNIMDVVVPDSPFVLSTSTTRNPALVRYEYADISPMVRVSPKGGWIERARLEVTKAH